VVRGYRAGFGGMEGALFVLPHHRGDGGARSLVGDFGELITVESGRPLRAFELHGLMGLGCVAVLLPAALAARTG
jgi:hypothetical protein